MERAKTTKKQKVLEHLTNLGTITSIEAIEKYGATRLADIIFKLRKEGYNIETQDVEFTDRYGNKGMYAKYVMKGKEPKHV